MRSLFLLLITCLALNFSAKAQENKFTFSIDTTAQPLGGEFVLTLQAKVDTLSRVTFPKSEYFGMLEVIRDYPTDTLLENDRWELIKRYGLAQYDSGRYAIPRLEVQINNRKFATDSIWVEVSNVAVDTTKQGLYEIKDIAEPQTATWEIAWWIWAILGLILLAAIYYIWKKRQPKNQSVTQEEEPYKTPLQRAMSRIESLDKSPMLVQGKVKDYYSELTDITRLYIEEAIEIPAMESTTSELIAALEIASKKKNMPLGRETLRNLERVLQQADLVKFAKSEPEQAIIAQDRSALSEVISTIDAAIPVVVDLEDDAIDHAALAALQIKKKRKQMLIQAVGMFLLLLFGLGVYFTATLGFSYVKDNLFGNYTKALYEKKEWVRSVYGNPGIAIETPEVLVRQRNEELFTDEELVGFEELQVFSYQKEEDFSVSIATLRYKEGKDIALDQAMEQALKQMENNGAMNLITKPEEFVLGENVPGLKASGTYIQLDQTAKKSTRKFYELIVIGHQNGIQQILVTVPEGDEFAAPLLERIIKSVELKTTAD